MPANSFGVLFDVDGTLVDTNYLHVVAWWHAFRAAGNQVSMTDIHRTVGQGAERLVQTLLDRSDDDVVQGHTDFYSPFPNWRGLGAFFEEFPGKPFVFGEWAVYGADAPRFVNQLFGWIRAHPRVRILMYNQGYKVSGKLALKHYPASARTIGRHLRTRLFAPFTPEWAAGGATPPAPVS